MKNGRMEQLWLNALLHEFSCFSFRLGFAYFLHVMHSGWSTLLILCLLLSWARLIVPFVF